MVFANRALWGEFVSHKVGLLFFNTAISMFVAMAGITYDSNSYLKLLFLYGAPFCFVSSIVLFLFPYRYWCIFKIRIPIYNSSVKTEIYKFRLLIKIKHAVPLYKWLLDKTRYKNQVSHNVSAYFYLGEEPAYQRVLLEEGVWRNTATRRIHGYKRTGLFDLVPLSDDHIPEINQPWNAAEFYIDVLSILDFIEDMERQYVDTARLVSY